MSINVVNVAKNLSIWFLKVAKYRIARHAKVRQCPN